MKSQTLFRVVQLPLSLIVDSNYKLEIPEEKIPLYLVRQGDCALFAQVRRITGQEWAKDHIVREIIFCNLERLMRNGDIAKSIVRSGFVFNGRQFYCGERSASMRRNGFASFIDSEIYFPLEAALDMGLPIESMEVVYSKWASYRGLFLTGVHLIE